MDMARSMLMDAKHVPNYMHLWAEAIHTANYLRNRMFSSAGTKGNKTPYETIMGKKPDVSHIRVFGSKAYIHLPKQKRTSKFGQRAGIRYCVGFSSGNAYKIYMPDTRTVTISRDVTFDGIKPDSNFPRAGTPNIAEVEDIFEHLDSDQDTTPIPEQEVSGSNNREESRTASGNSQTRDDLDEVTYNPGLRRSNRATNPPDRYSPGEVGMLALMNHLGNESPTVPTTYQEAVCSPEKANWKRAMDKEIDQLKKETWDLVPLPDGAKKVKAKWVYSAKTNAEGKVIRYRARLVAKGYLQRPGIDYDEVFAPVAKYTTVRFMLAVATIPDFEINQVDVKTAFLNGKLDAALYLEQPQGYVSKEYPNRMYRLKRAIYGLKQASRAL